jgi:hypothetical protein
MEGPVTREPRRYCPALDISALLYRPARILFTGVIVQLLKTFNEGRMQPRPRPCI